jgi:tripartite-type tricarboxylate transporter receptor subunit TctC
LRSEKLEAAALAIALLFSAPFAAHAQGGTYPDHPVTLIVPFSAGGDADVAARSLAVVAQQVTGQVHVPVNRAGAHGAIGSLAVRNARPDGYTLLLARVGSQVVLPALQPSVGYRWNDFTLLGLLELRQFTAALQIYGGDFFNVARSEFDPQTLAERPFDMERANAAFLDANRD